MAFLTVFGPEPGANGTVSSLGEGDVTLGRDPAASVVLDHREISRRHATIRSGTSGWEIHDLGSANGIRVQGHRMEAALLQDGDEIRIGPFRIVFSADAPAAPASPPPARPGPPPLPGPAPLAGPPPLPSTSFPSPHAPPPQYDPAPASPPPGSPGRRGAPRAPAAAPKGRAGFFVGGLLALALVPAIVAGFVLLSGPARPAKPATGPGAPGNGPVTPTPAAPALPDEPLAPAAAWPPAPDPAVRAEVDRAAASLESALGAGKLEEVFVHVHPEATADLRAAFEPHRSELGRVARLLSTRRLVVAEEAWAEYEVTEDGRTFAVVFEKVEGRWLLSSL